MNRTEERDDTEYEEHAKECADKSQVISIILCYFSCLDGVNISVCFVKV